MLSKLAKKLAHTKNGHQTLEPTSLHLWQLLQHTFSKLLQAWVQGHFQIMFSWAHCPLFQWRLPFLMRLMYLSGVWSYIVGAISTPLFIIVPILTIWWVPRVHLSWSFSMPSCWCSSQCQQWCAHCFFMWHKPGLEAETPVKVCSTEP